MDISFLVADADYYHVECQMKNDSIVLYPDQNNNLPEKLQCRVIFQDGSEHLYRIPAVRIQTYSLEEIHEKHLNLFIPYLLLRLKPRLDSKSHPLTKKELTVFVKKVILLLQEEMNAGYLTRLECDDYINLFLQASEHIFYHHPVYHKEVQRMTKPLIYIPSLRMKELEKSIAESRNALAESRNALAESRSALAEKDSEIALLRAKIAALEAQAQL